MAVLNSAKSVEAIKEVGYHNCAQGLYLQVSKQGTKSWLYRYTSPLTKTRREMGLGSFNFVSLAQARQYATDGKRLVINGEDPIEERKKEQIKIQLKQARNLTFKEIAEACIAAKAPEWKNAKHSQQWNNSLEAYAFPILGELPISDITTDLILKALEPIWITKAETASRVRQRIETIWDYGKARNYVSGENPARLRGHLDKILSKTVKVKRVRHFPALPYEEIGIFLQELRQRKGYSALALEFLILTAARTSEIIGAKWAEIDLEKKVWTLPADRMKVGKEHRVPLCSRAIEILTNITSNRNPEKHVFSGWKQNTGLSNNALLALLKKMGRSDITAHGFRSTFRDWAAEEAHTFANETIELALAHTIKNKAEAAYRRGDQLERRRELMAAWSEYIG
ncbi:integrase arm-type DNA-binding domain-containing protein [Planktomarina temperata]|nr:integrase arm-type DNA-binding domain-containing protein [Planktomarina temperata]